MGRWANSSVTDAFDAEHVDFAVLVEMAFATATIRVFGGLGEITYNGNTYSGLGEFGSISTIQERPDSRDFTSLTLTLAGDDPVMNAKLTDRDEYFGRSCSVYFVPFNLITMQPIAVEAAVFEGFMDVLQKRRPLGSVELSLIVRHHMSEWSKTIGAVYTHEYQRSIDAADDGMNQTHTVTSKQVVWGGRQITPIGGSGRLRNYAVISDR